MFSSFIGKNSTAEKAKLLLAYSDFYITFASDLTSFLFIRLYSHWFILYPYSVFPVTFKWSCITTQ